MIPVFAIYIPRRRVSANRHVEPSLGIANILPDGSYIPLVDIDHRIDKAIIDVVKTGWKLYGKTGIIISETAKGYHVIWATKTSWKKLNTLWTRLKHVVDNKWITLQRHRGFAIIRVRGKYAKHDIRPIIVDYTTQMDEDVYKWIETYLKLVRK